MYGSSGRFENLLDNFVDSVVQAVGFKMSGTTLWAVRFKQLI